jgi:hypothetical protein
VDVEASGDPIDRTLVFPRSIDLLSGRAVVATVLVEEDAVPRPEGA